MPKYGISLSNDDGRITSTPTASVNYDDITKYLNITHLSASSITINGAINSIITISNGVWKTYKASDYSNHYMVFDGNNWTPQLITVLENTASGDISGSYPFPVLKNISNVTSGWLLTGNGGVGTPTQNNLLNNISSGSIIIANSTNTLTAVSTASYNGVGEWVLGTSDGTSWSAVPASKIAMDIDVQQFTNPGWNTWNKRNSAHKWARIMILAGGGGGGGASGGNSPGAAGGGGGGFTDVEAYIGDLSTATVYVGWGGAGSGTPTRAASGEDSYFDGRSGGIYFSAKGGQGGIRPTPNVGGGGGDGGLGFGINGGKGAGVALVPNNVQNGQSRGGSCGGGSGYATTPSTVMPASSGGSSIYPNGFNLFGYAGTTVKFGSGGGGGVNMSDGGGGDLYGAGGGGGGRCIPSLSSTYGGAGSAGFVIVVTY
jgi:hypothetical protein